MKSHIWVLVVSLVVSLTLVGCVDQDFDAPPAGGEDPDLTANISIAEVKAMHTLGSFEEITEDLIIEAFVISSDEEGNFFRQLIIQDETAGIEMRIDATELHSVYPVGRKVFVKLQGLWLGDFNNLTQLGAAVVEVDGDDELARIPESLLDGIIFPGTYGHTIEPKTKTIDELSIGDVSTLIELSGVQFVQSALGSTYADAENLTAANHELENCDKDRVLVRTSGFASFANVVVPEGNGTLMGVLGIFGSDLQFILRDESDVSMEGERCQLGGGNVLTIQSLRNAFQEGQVIVDDGAIEGVVISDRNSGNHVGQNLFVQDESGGIVVRFTSNHSYDLGDEIQVDVSGQELSEFNGLLQVNGVEPDNAQGLGESTLPEPRIATVSELVGNLDTWESTLVKVNDATLSGQGTFGGTLTVTDASGSMIMFTRNQATFATTAVPSGQVDITAILSEFNQAQLVINSAEDAGAGGGGGEDLNESFDSLPDDADIDFEGWTNVAVKGTRLWRVQVFSGNHYAQATAFNDTEPEMEAWLVTPPIDVSVPKNLMFESAMAFWEHDGFSVLSSTNFTGDVETATWEPVDARLANNSDEDHEWIPSGLIDLSGFTNDVYIAFRYIGSGPQDLTTSYRVDNIIVEEQ